MLHQLHVVLRNMLPTICRITCTGLMDIIVNFLIFDLYVPFKFYLGRIKHTEYTCIKVNQEPWNTKTHGYYIRWKKWTELHFIKQMVQQFEILKPHLKHTFIQEI